MKKVIFCFLFIFCTGIVFCEKYFLGSNVTSLVALENFDGCSYLLYIQNDEIKGLCIDKNKYIQTLSLFTTENKITEIQGLCVCEAGKPIFAFIGKENDIKTLFTIQPIANNTLDIKKKRLYLAEGPITDCNIYYNYDNNEYFYFFMNNQELYVTPFYNNGIAELKMISESHEKIDFYKVYYNPNSQIVGYYITEDKKNASMFFIDSSGSNKIQISGYNNIDILDVFNSDSNDLFLSIKVNGITRLLEKSNDSFKEIAIIKGDFYNPPISLNDNYKQTVSYFDNTLLLDTDTGNLSYFAIEPRILYYDNNCTQFLYKNDYVWCNLYISQTEIKENVSLLVSSLEFLGILDYKSLVFMDKNNKQVIIASIDNLSIERTIVLPQNTEEIVKYIYQANGFILEGMHQIYTYSVEKGFISTFDKDLYYATIIRNGKGSLFLYYNDNLAIVENEVIYE